MWFAVVKVAPRGQPLRTMCHDSRMDHVAEIVLIIITVVVVFGAGKLPDLASMIGRLRSKAQRGLLNPSADMIDITPKQRASQRAEPGSKPGTRAPGEEDAKIEEPS